MHTSCLLTVERIIDSVAFGVLRRAYEIMYACIKFLYARLVFEKQNYFLIGLPLDRQEEIAVGRHYSYVYRLQIRRNVFSRYK